MTRQIDDRTTADLLHGNAGWYVEWFRSLKYFDGEKRSQKKAPVFMEHAS